MTERKPSINFNNKIFQQMEVKIQKTTEEITFFQEFKSQTIEQIKSENANLDKGIYKLEKEIKEFAAERKKQIKDLKAQKANIIVQLIDGGQQVTCIARKEFDTEAKTVDFYDRETGEFLMTRRMNQEDAQLLTIRESNG